MHRRDTISGYPSINRISVLRCLKNLSDSAIYYAGIQGEICRSGAGSADAGGDGVRRIPLLVNIYSTDPNLYFKTLNGLGSNL